MKKWMRFMVLAVMPAAMLVSCDEDGDDVIPPVQEDEARVMVVHASPDAPGVDLLVDGEKVNTDALNYPNNTGYLTIPAGTRGITVNAAGTSDAVIDRDIDFDKDKSYTIFATGSLGSNDIQPLVLTDDLTAPTTGNAKVRFVHLSPDAPAVDVAVAGDGGAVLFDGQEFREASAFISVPAGTYDLEVRLDADNTVVLPLDGIELQSGMIYTVFARGFVTLPEGNTNALGAQIIMHDME